MSPVNKILNNPSSSLSPSSGGRLSNFSIVW